MATHADAAGSSQVLTSQLYGVGLGLKRLSDGTLTVNKLAAGGSAAMSGRIQSGDILTGVGGTSILKVFFSPFLSPVAASTAESLLQYSRIGPKLLNTLLSRDRSLKSRNSSLVPVAQVSRCTS